MTIEERKNRFLYLYSIFEPDQSAKIRVQGVADAMMLATSSVRVYLMRKSTKAPSMRSLRLLETKMRRKKLL